MKKYLFTIALTSLGLTTLAQYNPQFPLQGHDAIHRNDTAIKAWATQSWVNRGWINIQDTTLGKVSAGADSNCLGKADVLTTSLGDGGSVVVAFDQPIKNGTGPDFVVFENAIRHINNDTLAFLELAKVAVSSNGIDFVEFPAYSLTPFDVQMDTFGYIDARNIHNLAGKYVANYGTPFDLEELKDSNAVDVNYITHIKITDIIGSISEEYATYDALGNIINDPFPTPFVTGGFDLDAVGVIHPLSTNNIEPNTISTLTFSPNPSTDVIIVKGSFETYEILDIKGVSNKAQTNRSQQTIDIKGLPIGNYKLGLYQDGQWHWQSLQKH